MRIVAIYALLDASGARRYVGKSLDPERRLKAHRREGKPWAESFAVLEQCGEHVWCERERWWIAHGKANGWPLENRADGGSGPPPYFVVPRGRVPWNKGVRGVCVAWNKGKLGSQVAWNKGKQSTAIQRERMSATRRGRKHSPAHRRAIADGLRGKPHPWRYQSAEAGEQKRQQLSDAMRGRERSLAHCVNLSTALRGHVVSTETRAKISATLRARRTL